MAIDQRQAEQIKEKIKYLYLENPKIHMDISLSRPKVSLKNADAEIIGTYANIFRIEESSGGTRRTHTLQYTDILMGYVTIHELQA